MSSHTATDVEFAWRKVSLGLLLKSIGAWVGLVGLFLLPEGQPFTFTLRSLAAGVLLDFAGRTLCSAAPMANRHAIYGSIAVQAFGICILIALFFINDTLYRAIGIVLVALSQVSAAFLFTTFLGEVGRALGRPDLEPQVELLQMRLANSVTTVSKIGMLAIIYGFLFFGLIIFVLLLMIFLPIYPLILLGIGIPIILILVSLGMMYVTYHSTVLKIRAAINQAGTATSDLTYE